MCMCVFAQVSLQRSGKEDGKELKEDLSYAIGIGLGHVKVLTVQVAF